MTTLAAAVVSFLLWNASRAEACNRRAAAGGLRRSIAQATATDRTGRLAGTAAGGQQPVCKRVAGVAEAVARRECCAACNWRVLVLPSPHPLPSSEEAFGIQEAHHIKYACRKCSLTSTSSRYNQWRCWRSRVGLLDRLRRPSLPYWLGDASRLRLDLPSSRSRRLSLSSAGSPLSGRRARLSTARL